MQHTFRPHTLLGLVAAAGAIAMMSAQSTPTAHADEISDLFSAVEGNLTAAQADYAAAFSDFSGADVGQGLAALLNGIDNDFVGAPEMLTLGTVEALENESISPGVFTFDAAAPPDFTTALLSVESFATESAAVLKDALTFFSAGDYVDGTYDTLLALDYTGVLAPNELLLGSVESLLGSL
jgi:hypothetical protein